MKKALSVYRDAIWLLGLMICLLFLLVGFIVEAVRPYDGDKEADTLDLSQLNIVDAGVAPVAPAGSGIVKTLSETKAAGSAYMDSIIYLCDSSFSALKDSGLVNPNQLWLGEDGHLYDNGLSVCRIVYPNDGGVITPAQAAMVAKPAVLVICVGQDGLSAADQSTFVDGYTQLVQSIQAKSADTVIILSSVVPVTTAYNGSDNLSGPQLTQVTEWVKAVSMNCGVYFADTMASLSSSGYLLSEYAGTDGKTLNTAGLQAVLSYLSTHAVS